MSKGWRYSSGDWNVICDSSGRKVKASDTYQRWDGLRVCKEDFEERHSQDFVKARQDKISVAFSRTIQPEVFVEVDYVVPLSCTPTTSTGESDSCVADCARADIRLLNQLID